MVYEFVNRGSLWDVLHNYLIPLNWHNILKMAIDAARGMSYLHLFKPPIIHRDLKSANLLVDSSFTVKICDFGLSKTKAIHYAMTGQTGTPGYMAPEIIASQKYTEKVDVYSFGIIFWELTTRQTPYHGMNPMQILFAVLNHGLRPSLPNSCPPSISSLINSCWHSHPDKRPHFDEIFKTLKNIETTLGPPKS